MPSLRTITLATTLCSAWATSALADPATPTEKPRVQFVDMSAMLIDGEIVKPRALHIDSKAKVKFARLFELKRSVLPRLQQTARDRALR